MKQKRYSDFERQEEGIMKKEKKLYKGWVDPMCTPCAYKKGK